MKNLRDQVNLGEGGEGGSGVGGASNSISVYSRRAVFFAGFVICLGDGRVVFLVLRLKAPSTINGLYFAPMW